LGVLALGADIFRVRLVVGGLVWCGSGV
jgi:hypothetical protein